MTKSECGKIGYLKARDKLDSAKIERSQKQRGEYYKNPKLCLECGGAIKFKNRQYSKFCSMECYRKFKGHKRVGRFCIECGKYIINKRMYKNVYCDYKCQCINNFKKRRDSGMTLKGETVRKYLIYTRPHRCEECGLIKWNGDSIPLEVHHIDGDSNNNSDDNIQLLCPNCHAQTPTFKGKNRGNGRKYRRVSVA